MKKVATKVACKQLCYMPLTPQVKCLFISKKIGRHMRWKKEGVYENNHVIVHLSNGEAWKALHYFNTKLAKDTRNVCIILLIYVSMSFNENIISFFT